MFNKFFKKISKKINKPTPEHTDLHELILLIADHLGFPPAHDWQVKDIVQRAEKEGFVVTKKKVENLTPTLEFLARIEEIHEELKPCACKQKKRKVRAKKVPKKYITVHSAAGKVVRYEEIKKFLDVEKFGKWMEGQTVLMGEDGEGIFFLDDVERFMNGRKVVD